MSSTQYFKNTDRSTCSEIGQGQGQGQGNSFETFEGKRHCEQDDHTCASTVTLIEKSDSGRRVSFGIVSSRIYQRTVGFHPDVTSGPALDLTWNYTATEDVSVDEFEKHNQPKRTCSQLRIPKYARIEMLRRECDVSKAEIARHVRMINAAKAQRVQTLHNLRLEPIEAKLQRFSRMVKRALKLRKPHEEEVKDLWKKSSSFSVSPNDVLGNTLNITLSSTKDSFDSSSKQRFKLCQRQLNTKVVKLDSLDRARHVSNFNLSLEVVREN